MTPPGFRVDQVSKDVFERELPHYSDIVGLPRDGSSFVRVLWDRLNTALVEVDANFPENDSIEFGEQGLNIPSGQGRHPTRLT